MNQNELDPEKKASPPPDRPFETDLEEDWLSHKISYELDVLLNGLGLKFLWKWRIGTLVAILIAGAFIVPTWGVYDQTPSNPQKGVGYFFITLSLLSR